MNGFIYQGRQSCGLGVQQQWIVINSGARMPCGINILNLHRTCFPRSTYNELVFHGSIQCFKNQTADHIGFFMGTRFVQPGRIKSNWI